MINIFVILLLCVWTGCSSFLDRKKFARRPGMVLRLCSLFLMTVLTAETWAAYRGNAPVLLPDVVSYGLLLLLSGPLSCESSRMRARLRPVTVCGAAVLAVAIPALAGLSAATVHLFTFIVVGTGMIVASAVSLHRWVHLQDALRASDPVAQVEVWIRWIDQVALMLLAGAVALLSDASPWLMAIPGTGAAALYVILYVRIGKCTPNAPLVWLRRMLTVRLGPLGGPGMLDEEFYRSVYRKCCRFMETRRPFLVESFSLEDLAAGVFTNRNYVSKAINQSSELNFKRFVNRYRVAHAQSLFRQNMSLRVSDLMMLSGCHSFQTFCAIFKLFTGQTPRDWCNMVRKQASEGKDSRRPSEP